MLEIWIVGAWLDEGLGIPESPSSPNYYSNRPPALNVCWAVGETNVSNHYKQGDNG